MVKTLDHKYFYVALPSTSNTGIVGPSWETASEHKVDVGLAHSRNEVSKIPSPLSVFDGELKGKN